MLNLGSLLDILILILGRAIDWSDIIQFPAWPITSMILVLFSAIYLYRSYRLEPIKRPGRWQLSLSDLYIATFFSAFCMAMWHTGWPHTFIFWGASASIIGGIWLLTCLMVAERRGFSKYVTKLPLAIGLLLKSYGYTAWASFSAFSILLGIFDGQKGLLEFWEYIFLGFLKNWSHADYLYYLTYVSALTLPIGWALCAFVLRKKKQDA